MDENDRSVSRSTSVVGFALVALLLITVLLAGLFFGKRYIASLEKPATVATTSEKSPNKQTKDKEAADKKIAEQRATEQEATKEKQAEQKKQAQQKAQEEKKKQEAARQSAPPAPGQSPQPTQNTPAAPAPSSPQTPAAPSPGSVAATGPEEAVPLVIAIIALTYCGYLFIASIRRTQALKRSNPSK